MESCDILQNISIALTEGPKLNWKYGYVQATDGYFPIISDAEIDEAQLHRL